MRQSILLIIIFGFLLSAYSSNSPKTGNIHYLGDLPIVVIAEKGGYYVYSIIVGTQALTFSIDGEGLINNETHSQWDYRTGQAHGGFFQGQFLTPIPSLTETQTTWLDFYPHGGIYEP